MVFAKALSGIKRYHHVWNDAALSNELCYINLRFTYLFTIKVKWSSMVYVCQILFHSTFNFHRPDFIQCTV